MNYIGPSAFSVVTKMANERIINDAILVAVDAVVGAKTF